ncbi:carbohydrate kinase [Parabacteroides sp. TM07-1AC]|jgi:fructokinase|uniref:carbohydrate kinase family protein n=1 Tax=Parabacteroides sp. TM07-1AC TaxID=2292363 RepID=UPI000F00D9EC|nr:carbohydrate kinase [Parabacteroides sp. TM07-1AC]RHU27945.1 carbohydrate kinase [Parabacteroides sp. TM07-1AC]
MENKKPIVVGIGELLWDVLPTGKRAGGAPINFVYHATQMGAEGYAISAVGNDLSGTEIVQELEKNHISNSLGTVEYPTGSVMVELKEGIPTYTIIEGVAWDHIPLTQESIDLIKRADAICFGTLALRSQASKETILSLLSYAREDALRFFDINIRQSYYSKELIETLLHKANVFKINDEELVLLRDMCKLEGSDDEVCRQILQMYNLKYLVLTAGCAFSSIYTADEVSTIPTPRVEVADTVGAGDSFSGAFVYSVLTGKSLREAHQTAVETAAFVCTQEGAWPPYPNKD